MGVYIDMEMPKPGEVIRIYNNGEARRCPVTEQKAFEVGVAIPVPEPHGRLVDADKPVQMRTPYGKKVEVSFAHIAEKNGGVIETIIEAEE